MTIKKQPFRDYGGNNKAPLTIKVNETDEQMLEIGRYILNLESRSGVIKRLAHIGLKVLLTNIGADQFHYLTNGERTRYIRDRPDIESYFAKRF